MAADAHRLFLRLLLRPPGGETCSSSLARKALQILIPSPGCWQPPGTGCSRGRRRGAPRGGSSPGRRAPCTPSRSGRSRCTASRRSCTRRSCWPDRRGRSSRSPRARWRRGGRPSRSAGRPDRQQQRRHRDEGGRIGDRNLDDQRRQGGGGSSLATDPSSSLDFTAEVPIWRWRFCLAGGRGAEWPGATEFRGRRGAEWPAATGFRGRRGAEWPGAPGFRGPRGMEWPAAIEFRGPRFVEWPAAIGFRGLAAGDFPAGDRLLAVFRAIFRRQVAFWRSLGRRSGGRSLSGGLAADLRPGGRFVAEIAAICRGATASRRRSTSRGFQLVERARSRLDQGLRAPLRRAPKGFVWRKC